MSWLALFLLTQDPKAPYSYGQNVWSNLEMMWSVQPYHLEWYNCDGMDQYWLLKWRLTESNKCWWIITQVGNLQRESSISEW